MRQSLGLLLGTDAPVVMPNGVDFSFFSPFFLGREAETNAVHISDCCL